MTVSSGTALIVDPDAAVREGLARALRALLDDDDGHGHAEGIGVEDLRSAVDLLLVKEELAIVVVAVDAFGVDEEGRLRGVEFAKAARLALPTPLVVATYKELPAGAAFELGRAGVRVLAQKPFTADELLRRIDEETAGPPPAVVPLVAEYVGRVGLYELEHDVRKAMVLQAVMQSGESRLAAARLLRVPRPIIQRSAPPKISPRGRSRRRGPPTS